MEYVEVQGAQIPALGLGTWQLAGQRCRQVVERALALGYRHFDTAQVYENEADIGGAIRQSDVPRDDLWITTKIARNNLGAHDVSKSTRDSLRRLGLDWIDLLLIHWPNPEVPLIETLAAMQRMQEEGLVRYLGVSNFTAPMLAEALTLAPITCVQAEYHPYLDQSALLAICRRADLLFAAYSPLARGRVAEDAKLRDVGRRHGKDATQVALRWLLQQHNVAALPKASNDAHLKSNLDIFDFELTAEDARLIPSFDAHMRLLDPEFAPDWDAR